MAKKGLMKMKTMKPVLGTLEVKVLNTIKKGTEDRFNIRIDMETIDTHRTLTDMLFYDVANTERTFVLPAVISALAEQTGLAREDFITENGEELDWDIDKVLSHIVGKTITIVRTTSVSERNGQVYYNINYRPNVSTTEEAVVL